MLSKEDKEKIHEYRVHIDRLKDGIRPILIELDWYKTAIRKIKEDAK